MADDDLVQIARELYAERPQEFVERRDERAKQARADGGRTLAAAVKKLKKPSAAAWVLNALARSARDRLDDLDDLRSRLRAAETAVDGVAMRQLGRDGRTLAGQITGRGRELADEAGVAVGASALAEVQETLRSMTVDDGVAAAVRTGFLLTAVSSTGFEAVDVSGAVALPSELPDVEESSKDAEEDRPSATVTDLSTARTRREERAARRAEEEERRAEAQRRREADAARKRLDELTTAADQADREHATTQQQVETADRVLADAQRSADEAGAAEESSRTAAAEAREAVDAAQAEVDRLTET